MVQALSRRDRMRVATTEEIKQTARRILVSEGPDAVSLRAIAREMGMTAPALYRYFGSQRGADQVRHRRYLHRAAHRGPARPRSPRRAPRAAAT